MPRSRNIKPSFFQNEELAELPFETRLLFIGLWCLADREGRLEYRPKKIKMQLFPADNINIEQSLLGLSGASLVQVYVVDNIKYIQITNFNKHQNPHQKEKASTIPAPDKPGASPADSLNLIPDSLNRIPDSGLSDSLNRIPDKNTVTLKHDDDAKSIFEFWQKTLNHPKAAFDDKRRALVRKQLKHYQPDDLKKAIYGCSVTPHNMGDNDRGEKYDSIELILRDAAHIDRFMKNADDPPSGKITTIQQTQQKARSAASRTGKMLFGDDYEPS